MLLPFFGPITDVTYLNPIVALTQVLIGLLSKPASR
jgi:hypothetical protein